MCVKSGCQVSVRRCLSCFLQDSTNVQRRYCPRYGLYVIHNVNGDRSKSTKIITNIL